MPKLKRFAFIHPLQPDQLQRFQKTFPDTEFLYADNGIPKGFEQAQAAAIHWTVKNVADVVAAGRSLRWLHIRSTGVEHLEPSIFRGSDIVLTNGAGNHAPNIAEHVLAMMLAFARQIPHFVRFQQQRSWMPVAAHQVFELSGQHVVIVGLGAIGMEFAKKAKALGMRVTGVRRNVSGAAASQFVDRIVTIADIDNVLAQADHVVLALPLTAQSAQLFDANRLARMKRGAYLYNVGRGQLVDHEALQHALINGQIAGAGLDVTDPEPLPPTSALWDFPNVIVTSHTAGATPHSYERFESLVLENMKRFVEGIPLLNQVNIAAGY